jgi:hypothetical protein
VSAIEPVFINSESTPGFYPSITRKSNRPADSYAPIKGNGREKNSNAPHVMFFTLRFCSTSSHEVEDGH